jgi:hypothetical protein
MLISISSGNPVIKLRPRIAIVRSSVGVGGADVDLDAFGHPLADRQIELLPGVLHDVFVQLVPGDAQAFADDDAGERKNGDLGSAAANVHDMLPCASVTGNPAPMAAAIGSSIR